MTLDELIDQLIELRDDHGVSGDTEVRGVMQPHYPLLGDIIAVTAIANSDSDDGVFIGMGDGTEYAAPRHYHGGWVDADAYDEDDE